MFFALLFLCLIHVAISSNNQEDLAITNYTQIGCLRLKSDKQFLVNNIQENHLLPYQTFSSPDMTTELCFRLCRRSFVLMFNNRKNCVCLYTINRPNEFNEYLGEFLPINDCRLTYVEVYSLTNSGHILPPLLSAKNSDWSFDGCYYLHGIQTVPVNSLLGTVDYIQAIELCRLRCQMFSLKGFYSYYLSRKKSCYCSPMELTQTKDVSAVRIPVKHCSFLPYVCNVFTTPCEKYYSGVSNDILIKIDVQQYCSSSRFSLFMLDRLFYMCFKSVLLRQQMTISKIIFDQLCLPLVVKTSEQWKDLTQSLWVTPSKLFIPIHRNSSFIFNELLLSEKLAFISDDFCVSLIRSNTNETLHEIIQCSAVHPPGYVLCAQNPLQSPIFNDEEFKMIHNESHSSVDEILYCPPDFILFNKICYYIHSSFVFNISSGERVCSDQYSNSTLVKFDSHEWGNINTAKFLGRTYEDILLEFFYYSEEKPLPIKSLNYSTRNHTLRLLLGNKNDPKECILRYFARSGGIFTKLLGCDKGGHPVCQCEPVPTITPMNTPTPYVNTSQTESIITTTQIIVSTPFCENCTTTTILSDEELVNNETDIDSESYNNSSVEITNTQGKNSVEKYQTLILIIISSVLALLILLIGVGLLVRYLRRNHGFYNTRNNMGAFRRIKRSSTTLTNSDIPNTPTVLYTRLKPPRLSTTEADMLISLDYSIPYEDNVYLLPAPRLEVIDNDYQQMNEVYEEPFYATLK